MILALPVAPFALTDVVRAILATPCSPSEVEDLLFLDAWERNPASGLGAVRRAGQIRRANPKVAAAIRSELAAR